MKSLFLIIACICSSMLGNSMSNNFEDSQISLSQNFLFKDCKEKCYRTVTITNEYWIPCASNPQFGGWYSSTNTCTASANSCETAQTQATACAIGANYADCLEAADANPPCPPNEP